MYVWHVLRIVWSVVMKILARDVQVDTLGKYMLEKMETFSLKIVVLSVILLVRNVGMKPRTVSSVTKLKRL